MKSRRTIAAWTHFLASTTLIFSVVASAHQAPGQIIRDDLVFNPLPTSVTALKQEEAKNSRQIQILKQQLHLYSEYLASKGNSLEIRFQRHLNSLPETIFVLGAGSGTVTGGAGLLGLAVQDAGEVSRRFFWAGAIMTIVAVIGSHFLKTRVADSPEDIAREKMVEELDATQDSRIRSGMEILMAKQLFDLENQNRAIRVALRKATNFSTDTNANRGIIPQHSKISLQKSPSDQAWNPAFSWNGF